MLQGLLSSFDLNHFNTRPSFSKKEVGTVSEREVCTHFVDSPVEEYVHTVAAERSVHYHFQRHDLQWGKCIKSKV